MVGAYFIRQFHLIPISISAQVQHYPSASVAFRVESLFLFVNKKYNALHCIACIAPTFCFTHTLTHTRYTFMASSIFYAKLPSDFGNKRGQYALPSDSEYYRKRKNND